MLKYPSVVSEDFWAVVSILTAHSTMAMTPLIALLYFMHDFAYHTQKGNHVLFVLPDGTCRLVLELRLDVGRAMLEDQVVRPGSVLDSGVLILLILLLHDSEYIQV